MWELWETSILHCGESFSPSTPLYLPNLLHAQQEGASLRVSGVCAARGCSGCCCCCERGVEVGERLPTAWWATRGMRRQDAWARGFLSHARVGHVGWVCERARRLQRSVGWPHCRCETIELMTARTNRRHTAKVSVLGCYPSILQPWCLGFVTALCFINCIGE